MATTSINIQPCKVASSELHNRRLKDLDYVRSDLRHLNESWQSDGKPLQQHLDEIKDIYKQHKGKKMHAKATPLREGVIVVDERTTLSDLQRFTSACQKRWGIKPLQIYLHRDEGHYNEASEWKSNCHAHIVWNWTDEKGVTYKLNRWDMSEMQTLLAETLGMERGISSDKKHLSSLQFKSKAEEQKLSETQSKLQEAQEEFGDIQSLQKEIENAVKAEIKPIEDILESNTTRSMFWGKKVDYEAVIIEIKQQEKDRAISRIVGIQKENLEISRLKDQLSKSREEHEKYVNFITKIAGDGFQRFLSDLNRWTEKAFTNIEKIAMWVGQKLKDKRTGYIYSTNQDDCKLRINGKTIDEVQEERKRKIEQRKSLQEERLSPRRRFRR